MRIPFSVQVFLVRVDAHELSYLLFLRRSRADLGLPAFWQGVSGALEPGESFVDAALREVREESGIALSSVVDTEFRHCYPIRPEWRKWYGDDPEVVEEHVLYALVVDSTEPVLSDEHSSWRWCSEKEALSLLTFGANSECLRAVARSLRKAQNGRARSQERRW